MSATLPLGSKASTDDRLRFDPKRWLLKHVAATIDVEYDEKGRPIVQDPSERIEQNVQIEITTEGDEERKKAQKEIVSEAQRWAAVRSRIYAAFDRRAHIGNRTHCPYGIPIRPFRASRLRSAWRTPRERPRRLPRRCCPSRAGQR